MVEKNDQLRLILEAIKKLSETQGKMTIEDIKRETGISKPDDILKELKSRGTIYYVNEKEFKKTP